MSYKYCHSPDDDKCSIDANCDYCMYYLDHEFLICNTCKRRFYPNCVKETKPFIHKDMEHCFYFEKEFK